MGRAAHLSCRIGAPQVAALVVGAAVLAGCGPEPVDPDGGPPPDAFVAPDAVVPPDAGRPDAGPRPDTGPPTSACDPDARLGAFCQAARECDDGCFCNGREACQGGTCVAGADACDDGVDCTSDSCDEVLRQCDNVPDDGACDDDDVCTGAELCDDQLGCLRGLPINCSDMNSCTIDSCDPGTGMCSSTPRDLDGDGFADARCAGGDDCDDDPLTGFAVNPERAEDCDNGIDDDCDGAADLVDEDCAPNNDTCADPIRIVRSGIYDFSTRGLRDDYALSCEDGAGSPDAVFRIVTSQTRDVRVELLGGPRDSALELRAPARCDASAEPLGCASSTTTERAVVRLASAPAGEYALLVAPASAGLYQLDVRITSPTPPPPHDACDASAPLITGDGTFSGQFESLGDDHPTLACASRATRVREAAYRLRLDQTRNVEITFNGASSTASQRDVAVSIVDDCDAPVVTSRACARATFGDQVLSVEALPAGDYFILVEEDDTNGVASYELAVRLTTPVPRAAGDVCETAVDVTAAPGALDLADLQNDGGLGCGGQSGAYRDAFFQFTLSARSDVVVTTAAPQVGFHLVSVATACGDPLTELTCEMSPVGEPHELRLMGLEPGLYTIAVAAPDDRGEVRAQVQITEAP